MNSRARSRGPDVATHSLLPRAALEPIADEALLLPGAATGDRSRALAPHDYPWGRAHVGRND
jgi:hypothetical protein